MTESLLCSTCNRPLVLGTKDGKYQEWCPFCEGFEVLSKKNAMKQLDDQHNSKISVIKKLCSKYTKDSIIGSLMAFREGDLHFQDRQGNMDFELFMSISYVIKEIVNDDSLEFGDRIIEAERSDFQQILQNSNWLLIDLKFVQHVRNNVCQLVKIPKEKVRDFVVEYDKNIEYGLASPAESSGYHIKFTKKWLTTVENFEKYGLHPKLKAIESNLDSDDYISDLKKSIGLKLSFDMVCPDSTFIDFPDFSNKRRQIFFLKEISKVLWDDVIVFSSDMQKRTFMCDLKPCNIEDLMLTSLHQNLNLKEMLDLITFDETRCEHFPLVYLSATRRGFYIPPYTSFLIHKYLNVKYVLDEVEENAEEGKSFEREIADKLESVGISTKPPNQVSGRLMNIKDDPENPKLEIDVVGHTKDTLWVIDCKHFFLEKSFLTGEREKHVRRKLIQKKIDEKQKKRIEYIKANLGKFGLSSKRIKNFKSAIVTLLKEPLDNVDSNYLIASDDLHKLHEIPNFE